MAVTPRGRGKKSTNITIPSLDQGASPKGGVGRGKTIPWDEVRREYVEGVDDGYGNISWPKTLGEHATRWNLSTGTVQQRASRERWTELRNSFMQAQANKIRKERTKRLADGLVRFDDDTFKVAQLGMAMTRQRLTEIAKDVQDRENLRKENEQKLLSGQPVTPVKDVSNIDARELESLSRAAQSWHQLGRDAAGEEALENAGVPDMGEDIQQSVTNTVLNDKERMKSLMNIMQRANMVEALMEEDGDSTTTEDHEHDPEEEDEYHPDNDDTHLDDMDPEHDDGVDERTA